MIGAGSARSQSRGMSSSLLAEQNGKDLQIGQKSHLSTLLNTARSSSESRGSFLVPRLLIIRDPRNSGASFFVYKERHFFGDLK